MGKESVEEKAPMPTPVQMCEVEAQSARRSIQCDRPHFPGSSDAVQGDCTNSDDAAFKKLSDLEGAAPFSIRGYVAAVREVNLLKCWPFSQKLLEDSIKEGKHPLLPPLSPCGCVVHITGEYYHDEIIGFADEDMDEACGINDGPQIQVQIDLSKCEPEIDVHDGGVDTTLVHSPSKPEKPPSDAANSQEIQTPCSPHKQVAAYTHGIPFPDGALVVKKQAPRSIREIRKSIMQGCLCFDWRDPLCEGNIACRDCHTTRPKIVMDGSNCLSLDSADVDLCAGPGAYIKKKHVADHENISDITQQESSQKECDGSGKGVSVIESTLLDASPETMCNSLKNTEKDVCHIPPIISNKASLPLPAQAEMCENAVFTKNMPAHARSEYTTIRASVSDSQSVDKSLESYSSKSSASRPFSDHVTQQDSYDRIPCLDNIPQQRCPVCLLFQSSSNTALNAHIDRCLAASSTEAVEKTKSKLHRAKVRKKRSMAELFLVAPPCANADELPSVDAKSICSKQAKESTSVACSRRQKDIKRLGPQNTHTAVGGTSQQNGNCKLRSQAKALKFLQWKSRASPSYEQQIPHGASKRGAFQGQETGIPSLKNKGFLGRTLEWKTKSVLRKTRNWKRQKVNHESVAEMTHNAPDVQERKAQTLRTLLQRDRNRHNQDLVKHAMPCQPALAGSKIDIASKRLHSKVLQNRTELSTSAIPKELKLQNASKETAQVITSNTLMTVIGSRETTLEFMPTDDCNNDEMCQDSGDVEKVQFQLHIKPGKKRKKKGQQSRTDDLNDDSNLQLAIIRIPSIAQSGRNVECVIDRGNMQLEQSPMQTQAGRAEAFLETEIPSQTNISKQGNISPRSLRRAAEEWSIQDPSLPLFSSMIEEPQGKTRNLPNSRSLETRSPEHSVHPFINSTAPFPNSNKSGGPSPLGCASTCVRDIDNVSVLHLGHQPKRISSLHNQPLPWHCLQKGNGQIQMKDCHHAPAPVFLPTTFPETNNISQAQHYRAFPFSLCATERAQWPRNCEEGNLSMAGSEHLSSSILESNFIQPLQVAQITGMSGASNRGQEFAARQETLRRNILMADAGRHVSILQQNAEANQISTQSPFRKDHSTVQNSSFQTSSRVETWQAQNLPQNLPPWMQAAIQAQRTPDFTSMGTSTNSISQSCVLNATRNTSTEASRGSSLFDMIGNPVLRLMGKTMVLTPEAQQGRVDLTTNHFNGQSKYINFLQSLDPGEVNHNKQWNDSQVQTQPGIVTQDYLSSVPMSTRRNNGVQSYISSESHSIPQLQDFIMRTTSSQNGSLPSANQRSCRSSQLSGSDVLTQDLNSHPLHPRGSPNFLSTTFHRAHANWQHQNVKGPTPFNPSSSFFCQHNKSMSSSGFSEGRTYNNFNSILPRVHVNSCNSRHAVQNVTSINTQDPETLPSSPFPSWLSSAGRTDKAYQPARVIVLDDEDGLCSFDTSAPRPLGQQDFTKPAGPAALQTNQENAADRRARIPDSRHPAREKMKNKAFIPIIYTVGSFGDSPFLPGGTGPTLQFKFARDRECRVVENSQPVMNTRKRVGSIEHPQGRAKTTKTSGVVSPAGTSGNEASNVSHTVKQIPSMDALRAAAERTEGVRRRKGTSSLPEVLVSRNASNQLLNKSGEQYQASANVSEGSRLRPSPLKPHEPKIGMCSINMNPAEVDCQDAGQFMSTPPSMSSSQEKIVHDRQPSMDARICLNASNRTQPIVQSQETGFSNSPSTSSTVNIQISVLPPMENMQGSASSLGTSLRNRNLLSETSNGKPANEEKSHLPMIYDSSKKPSSCGTPSMSNTPFSLLPDSSSDKAGAPQECITSRIRSSFEATAPSHIGMQSIPGHRMQSLKVTGKFVIVNGRVSLMEAQKDNSTHI